jgi:amidohydrolase
MSDAADERLLDSLNEQGISRRRLLQLAGVATAAGASLGAADGALAQVPPTDAALIPGDGEKYEAKTGRAQASTAKETALAWIDNHAGRLIEVSDEVWEHAELSMREWSSAIAVANLFRRQGFEIEWGTAGQPAAFIATFTTGHGGPAIGFSGEYDALPGLSQKKAASIHEPGYEYDAYAPRYAPGHGCAHNTLGAAAAGGAIATAEALKRHGVAGTVRYFASTGEEQLIGKAYAVKAGAYNGLDAFVDWHPGSSTNTGWGTNSAIISASFTFLGATSHGGSPLDARGALDGVQLLVTMSEYLREKNVAASGRMHYVVANGGGAPNVLPDIATAWFYAREGSPARTQVLFDKLVTCAEAAAAASRTELRMRINSAVWNQLGNRVGAELVHENMTAIGPPQHSAATEELANAIQKSIGRPQNGMSKSISPLNPPNPTFLGGGSTDVADITWNVPTVRLNAATNVPGAPNHHWAVSSTAATDAAHRGLVAAAKYLAATAVDLITQPKVLEEMKAEFRERTKDVEWKSMLPDDAQPPLYEPPEWFLRKTGQGWPPPGITWPPEQYISRLELGTTGPQLPPVG